MTLPQTQPNSETCVPRDDLPEAAIEAAARRIERFGWPYKEKARGVARAMLTAALPHLIDDAMVERARRAYVDACNDERPQVDSLGTCIRAALAAALTGRERNR